MESLQKSRNLMVLNLAVVGLRPMQFCLRINARCRCSFNKNLCGRDGRTICGPQCVAKSTSLTLAVDEKTIPMATITGRTDRRTDRQSATQYAAPSYREEGRIISAQ